MGLKFFDYDNERAVWNLLITDMHLSGMMEEQSPTQGKKGGNKGGGGTPPRRAVGRLPADKFSIFANALFLPK